MLLRASPATGARSYTWTSRVAGPGRTSRSASSSTRSAKALARTGWTVHEDAVIGLFSFQKYVIYRDLLDHGGQVAASRSFAASPTAGCSTTCATATRTSPRLPSSMTQAALSQSQRAR